MSTPELKQLLYKRSLIKSQLTKFNQFLDDIEGSHLTKASGIELESRLQRVLNKQNDSDELQIEIDMLSEDQSLHLEINLFIKDTFYKSIAPAKVCLSSFKNDINLSSKNNSITNHTNIKLPAIELPCFNGNYANWRAFEDSLLAFVDKNDSLSDVEKLCYVRSKLKDKKSLKLRLFSRLESHALSELTRQIAIKNRYYARINPRNYKFER